MLWADLCFLLRFLQEPKLHFLVRTPAHCKQNSFSGGQGDGGCRTESPNLLLTAI